MLCHSYLRHLHTLSAALFVALVLAACERAEPAKPGVRPALAYQIRAADGVSLDAFTGEIRARVEADHAFRTPGKITRRHVDLGASVKRGQVLAQLDPQDARLAAEAARAQLSALQTEADFAAAELTRFRDLFAKGFVSQSTLDQKANVAAAANARVAAQRASANVTSNQAGYATLHAELDGVVTQVFAEAGQVVAAGQPVLRIANPREREMAINVPEGKLNAFRGANAKRPIVVQLANDLTTRYPARIREVGAAADAVTRTYPVRLAIDKSIDKYDANVQLGMSAIASFTVDTEAGTWSVPHAALSTRGTATGVWRIGADGKVSFVPVTVLRYRETTATIRADAIKTGDIIVAAGVQKLIEGETIKPITDNAVTGERRTP